jgi:negative regulator of flagellin synthesis FlgM
MIDGIGNTRVSVSDTSQPRAGAVSAQPTKTAQKRDTISMLPPAHVLAQQGPPVDTVRIDAVREALSAGTYTINARQIADRMIALDLPDHSR